MMDTQLYRRKAPVQRAKERMKTDHHGTHNNLVARELTSNGLTSHDVPTISTCKVTNTAASALDIVQ